MVEFCGRCEKVIFDDDCDPAELSIKFSSSREPEDHKLCDPCERALIWFLHNGKNKQ